MNQTRNKKGGKLIFRDDRPLIFKRDGYTCVQDRIWEKIIKLLRGEKSGGDRANEILTEIEK